MRHVVVIGGSFAGPFAAWATKDFARVTIVEADGLVPADDVLRKGVPQGRHMHTLLTAGHELLEHTFPGLTEKLVSQGAFVADHEAVRYYTAGVLQPPVTGFPNLCATRNLIEHHVRRRVLADERVGVTHGRVCGLVFEDSRTAGIRYRESGSTAVVPLDADLMVDAKGRSSSLGAWPEDAGWPAPAVERKRIDMRYATVRFRRGPELPETASVLAPPPAGGRPHVGQQTAGLMAVEGDQWLATITASGDRKPSSDPDGFRRECARLLAAPLRTVAAQGEMDGGTEVFTLTHTARRDFMALERFPGGPAVVGDAVASFNPLYGQGITSAAARAACLKSHFDAGSDMHARAVSFFERVAEIVGARWELATWGDAVLIAVGGRPRWSHRMRGHLMDLLRRAMTTDVRVYLQLLEVWHQRADLSSLRRPRFLWTVASALVAQRTDRPRGSGRRKAGRVSDLPLRARSAPVASGAPTAPGPLSQHDHKRNGRPDRPSAAAGPSRRQR
jgi:hypothetical protein